MPVNRIDSVASKFFLFIVCLLVAKSKEPVKLEKFNIIDDTLTYFIIKKESSRDKKGKQSGCKPGSVHSEERVCHLSTP